MEKPQPLGKLILTQREGNVIRFVRAEDVLLDAEAFDRLNDVIGKIHAQQIPPKQPRKAVVEEFESPTVRKMHNIVGALLETIAKRKSELSQNPDIRTVTILLNPDEDHAWGIYWGNQPQQPENEKDRCRWENLETVIQRGIALGVIERRGTAYIGFRGRVIGTSLNAAEKIVSGGAYDLEAQIRVAVADAAAKQQPPEGSK